MTALTSHNLPDIGMKESHRNTSWTHLNQQRKDGMFCDIILHCAGGEVAAHKCVLASVSEYFKTAFTSPISSASSTNSLVQTNGPSRVAQSEQLTYCTSWSCDRFEANSVELLLLLIIE